MTSLPCHLWYQWLMIPYIHDIRAQITQFRVWYHRWFQCVYTHLWRLGLCVLCQGHSAATEGHHDGVAGAPAGQPVSSPGDSPRSQPHRTGQAESNRWTLDLEAGGQWRGTTSRLVCHPGSSGRGGFQVGPSLSKDDKHERVKHEWFPWFVPLNSAAGLLALSTWKGHGLLVSQFRARVFSARGLYPKTYGSVLGHGQAFTQPPLGILELLLLEGCSIWNDSNNDTTWCHKKLILPMIS
jgi:hypothetical protein